MILKIDPNSPKPVYQQIIDQVVQQSDKDASLELSQEKIPGSGGFLLTADKISTRVTWEVLLTEARRELEPELAGMLFPASAQASQL